MRIHDFQAANSNGGNFFAGRNAGNESMSIADGDAKLASANVGIGDESLLCLTTGNQNVAIGAYTMNCTTTGSDSVGVGYVALAGNTTGYANTAVGSACMYRNTSGTHNTAMGLQALYHNTTGKHNTALGRDAGFNNSTGNWNTSLGVDANPGNTTGHGNTAVGGESGYTSNLANQNVTGSNNTWVGYQTGSTDTTQHDNCIALGYRALNDADNQTVIGNDDTDDTRVFGAFSSTGPITVHRFGDVVAGGDTSVYLRLTRDAPALYAGSGPPVIDAPQGSLYQRNDGEGVSTSLYVNLDGEDMWKGLMAADQAAAQANSSAATLSELVGDFNSLLASLRAAGLVAPNP